MRVYVAFDDTDTLDADRGTGKLVRWFEKCLPEGSTMRGVVRQQLLVDDAIPYTSHNSSACAIIDISDPCRRDDLISRAVDHIEKESLAGSDPGLCVVCHDDPALKELTAFGRLCATSVVTQKDALRAARGVHLSGHGGTQDGIIGAAAGVGLTASGWGGRFIEYGRIREFPNPVSVKALEEKGIHVLSLDRDSLVPGPEDMVVTNGWLRPRHMGFKPVVPVLPRGKNLWESMGKKNRSHKGKEGHNNGRENILP